jgi:hypothetical protein
MQLGKMGLGGPSDSLAAPAAPGGTQFDIQPTKAPTSSFTTSSVGPSSALADPRQVAAAQALGLSPEDLQKLLSAYGPGVA